MEYIISVIYDFFRRVVEAYTLLQYVVAWQAAVAIKRRNCAIGLNRGTTPRIAN